MKGANATRVAACAAIVALGACTKTMPLDPPPAPSASVEAASLVRVHGYVTIPCHGRELGDATGIRIVFKTRAGVLLGKATTGPTEFTTRNDGACEQRAPYTMTLPRLRVYVVRDPLHDRDLIATLPRLRAADYEWDFRS